MDIEILLWLQGLREAAGPAVETIAKLVTELPLSPLSYVIPFLLFWCLDKRAGKFVMIGYGISASLLNIVKVFVCAPRPWIRDPRITPSEEVMETATGYSFPSGHVQTTGAIYGGTGWYYRSFSWPLILTVVLTLVVAFTRCFLSVHTPQDVIVGILVVIVSLWATEWVMKAIEENTVDAGVVLGVVLAAVALMTLVTAIKPYPEVEGVDSAKMILDGYKAFGITAGIAVGLYLERRYVDFTTDCSVRDKVIRVVISLVLTALVYLACQLLKMAGLQEVYGFSRSFFCAAAAIWAGPAIAGMVITRFFAPSAE